MGLRFKKSVQIAPGLKLNLNKKSVGITAGTKGAHYTINSSGKRTASVGIPGTGISYSESSGDTTHSSSKKKTTSSNFQKGGNGCLAILLGIFLIGLLLALYTFAWIPALIYIIYIVFSKKYVKNQKIKRIVIALLIFITSLISASTISDETALTNLEISVEKTEYIIGDSTEVSLSLTPSDAIIDTLEISSNDVVSLDYSDDKAIITFTSEGTASIYFIANDSIESNSIEITVKTDADDSLEQNTSSDNNAIDDTDIEGDNKEDNSEDKSNQDESISSEDMNSNNNTDPSTDTSENESSTSDKPSNTEPEDEPNIDDSVTEEETTETYVLNTNTKKFHYPSCSSVSTIKAENYQEYEGPRDDLINKKYDGKEYKPCGRCHP